MTDTKKIRLGTRQRVCLEAIVRQADRGDPIPIGTTTRGTYDCWALSESVVTGNLSIDARTAYKVAERLSELGLVDIDRDRYEIRPTRKGRRLVLGDDAETLHTRYALHPRKGWVSMEQNVGIRAVMAHPDDGDRAIETDSVWVPNRVAAAAVELLEAADKLFEDRVPGDLYHAKIPSCHPDEFEALRAAVRKARGGDR